MINIIQIKSKFQEVLKEAIKYSKLSQAEVARRIGIRLKLCQIM